jgi:hypothetical protein
MPGVSDWDKLAYTNIDVWEKLAGLDMTFGKLCQTTRAHSTQNDSSSVTW